MHHLILTDGSKGTWNPDEDIATLVKTREVEQRAAAAALGTTGDVVMLGEVDGELESGLAQRERVAYWIRALEPDVVLGHDPWKRYRLHPDHRHAGWLAVDGVVAARDPLFFPDHGLPHHRPDVLLLFEAEEPDHVEDVTGYEAAKLAALLEHRSQFVTTMYIDEADTGEQLQAFRDRRLRPDAPGRRADRGHLRRGVPGHPRPLSQGLSTATSSSVPATGQDRLSTPGIGIAPC